MAKRLAIVILTIFTGHIGLCVEDEDKFVFEHVMDQTSATDRERVQQWFSDQGMPIPHVMESRVYKETKIYLIRSVRDGVPTYQTFSHQDDFANPKIQEEVIYWWLTKPFDELALMYATTLGTKERLYVFNGDIDRESFGSLEVVFNSLESAKSYRVKVRGFRVVSVQERS